MLVLNVFLLAFVREDVYFLNSNLRNVVVFSVIKRDRRGQLVRFYPDDFDTTSIIYARPYGYRWENCENPEGKPSKCLIFPRHVNFSIMENTDAKRFINEISESLYVFKVRVGMFGGKYRETSTAVVLPSEFEIIDFSSTRPGRWKVMGSTIGYYASNIDTATITVKFRIREDTLYKKLLQALEKEKQVSIIRMRKGIRLRLDESILFETGRATLKPESKELIEKIYRQLNFERIKLLRVEGHTNNIPIRGKLKEKFPSNWELSTARASAVVRYLIKLGAPRDKLVACGYADTRPIASNDTPEGREINKRVEFIIITGEETQEEMKIINERSRISEDN